MRRKDAKKKLLEIYSKHGDSISEDIYNTIMNTDGLKDIKDFHISFLVNPKKILHDQLKKYSEYKKYESCDNYDSLSEDDFVGWIGYRINSRSYMNYARTKACLGSHVGYCIHLYLDHIANVAAYEVNIGYGKKNEEGRQYFSSYFDMFIYEITIAFIHELIHIHRLLNVLSPEEISKLPDGTGHGNLYRNEKEEKIAEEDSVSIANLIIDDLLSYIKMGVPKARYDF